METDNMEDKKFERLINDLNNLEKIEAPDNFEIKLQEKLNTALTKEYSKTKKINKLIPAFALSITIILLFLIYRPFNDEYEDPFQIQPQIREDVIALTESDDKSNLNELLNETNKENDSNLHRSTSKNRDSNQQQLEQFDESYLSDQNTKFQISKEELNFIKPVMSDEEKMQVQLLKQKIMNKAN